VCRLLERVTVDGEGVVMVTARLWLLRQLAPRHDPLGAYETARGRFVATADTTTITLADPVLDLTVTVPISQRHHLPDRFRSSWLTRYLERSDL
jgi:hypothetical protein